jgi:transcriptional regulator with XRE-family HTH domain
MTRAHGTAAMYSHGPCRCAPCSQAASAAARHRYRMIAYGQWQPFTDATPAREHVRSLQAQGLGWQRIAELAGVAAPTVSSMLYGRSGRPPTGKIRTATAEALLAFRPGLDDLPATAPVDAAGTRRRMQALAAAGWSAQRLAGYLGFDRAHAGRIIRGDNPRVSAATARAVRGLYDELWDRPPPEGTRWEKVAANRARDHARQQGWPPPMAWDDDKIDDPAAKPTRGWRPPSSEPPAPARVRAPRPSRQAPSGSPVVAAAIREAREAAGMSQRRLAIVVGVTETAIQHYEYAKRTPSAETWVQLELALGPLGVVRDREEQAARDDRDASAA